MKQGLIVQQRVQLQLLQQRLDAAVAIGAAATLQANELKAWIIALLQKIGPQHLSISAFEAVGHAMQNEVTGERGLAETVFLVEPVEEGTLIGHRDGIPELAGQDTVRLSVGKLEDAPVEPPSEVKA